MNQKGSIIALALVFGVIFLILIGGLFGFILQQHRYSLKKSAYEDALHIAEAGANYYRWHLAHNPGDVQDGKGWCCAEPPCDVCGPYEHDYIDPETNETTGKFILEIKGKEICGEILGVQIISTGYSLKYPDQKRKIKAKYASTPIAEYAYLLNDSVWAGGDRDIKGKYHSNGGIRMDGNNNSLVTSGEAEWTCTRSFGCCGAPCQWSESSGCYGFGWPWVWVCPDYTCDSPCQWVSGECKCPGVFGSGEGGEKGLWKFPVVDFPFKGITSDLSKMKDLATASGRYYPPSKDINPSGLGYHVIFKNDGRFDIKIVTGLEQIKCYSVENGWNEVCNEKIVSEVVYQENVVLPSGCGLIFVEDELWIEGIVKGKITIASADLEDEFHDTSVILNGNLDYTALDGSDSLAVITQNNILIPLHSPNQMILRGVFVAQKGHFGRHHYDKNDYPVYYKREKLEMYGSVVSYGRVGTKWSYSNGMFASGYQQRDNFFDQKLALDPPPLLPYISEDLQFISWEEIQ